MQTAPPQGLPSNTAKVGTWTGQSSACADAWWLCVLHGAGSSTKVDDVHGAPDGLAVLPHIVAVGGLQACIADFRSLAFALVVAHLINPVSEMFDGITKQQLDVSPFRYQLVRSPAVQISPCVVHLMADKCATAALQHITHDRATDLFLAAVHGTRGLPSGALLLSREIMHPSHSLALARAISFQRSRAAVLHTPMPHDMAGQVHVHVELRRRALSPNSVTGAA